jgi:hypothetical protein
MKSIYKAPPLHAHTQKQGKHRTTRLDLFAAAVFIFTLGVLFGAWQTDLIYQAEQVEESK